MSYVSNVENDQQTPAQQAYQEAERLGKLIGSLTGYIEICESPTVNRLDEAAELRRHVSDLQQQKAEIMDQLTGNATPAGAAQQTQPLVLGNWKF